MRLEDDMHWFITLLMDEYRMSTGKEEMLLTLLKMGPDQWLAIDYSKPGELDTRYFFADKGVLSFTETRKGSPFYERMRD